MRNVARFSIAAIGVSGAFGAALAADLTATDIKTLISGKSVYLETTAASITGKAGQGVIYYSEDGAALYSTPAGVMWHGKWEIKGNTLCTDWKEKPNNPCSRYDKTGDVLSIVDLATGQTRAKIVKSVPGNAEKLAP